MKTTIKNIFSLFLISVLPIFITTFLNSCGGSSGTSYAPMVDLDGDGIPDDQDSDADGDSVENNVDCNDMNATIHPGALDDPDSLYVDANCDGIDGDLATAIWVSQTEGAPGNPGTITSPLSTINEALALAITQPATPNIYIVKGTYAEDIAVPDKISIYGGYSLLDSNATRTRNIPDNLTIISGNATGQFNITLDVNGNLTLEYTVLINGSSSSTIDGLTITCDPFGISMITNNSNITIQNNHISCPEPQNPKNVSAGIIALIGSNAPQLTSVNILDNTIEGSGTNDTQGLTYGILAMPTSQSENQMTVQAIDNSITLNGTSNIATGIFAGDNDDNPSDDPSTDGRASISLVAKSNTIHIESTVEAGLGIAGGGFFHYSAAPPDETFYYLSQSEISGNFISFKSTPLTMGVFFGVMSALVRQDSLVANNIIFGEAEKTDILGIVSGMASTNIYHNTIYFKGDNIGVVGISSIMKSNDEAINYFNSMKAINNNIIAIFSKSGNNCQGIGIREKNTNNDPNLLARVSPSEVKNNAIYFDPLCGLGLHGSYQDEINGVNLIISISDLNSKTGFAANDPSIIEGNIDENPLFNDPSLNDFSLQDGSPCIDTGLTLPDITLDFAENIRPQGSASDIGAFER